MAIPNNFYRYKQLPIWDTHTIPKPLLGVHNTKVGVYGKIHVLSGALKYTIYKNEDGGKIDEYTVEAGDYCIAEPQQWHSVAPVGDLKMYIDFYKEKSEDIQKNEESFHKNFLDKSPHFEVMYLASLLDTTQHKTALDIGSGGGRNSLFLAHMGLEVTSVDKNLQSLAALSSLATTHSLPINVKHMNLNQESINQSYDVMIATVSLQFIDKQAASSLLTSMKQHTNIGGYNLIIVPIQSDDVNCQIDFANMQSYEYYLEQYSDWEMIHKDNYIGQFHKKDENGTFIKSRFATIIARKK